MARRRHIRAATDTAGPRHPADSPAARLQAAVDRLLEQQNHALMWMFLRYQIETIPAMCEALGVDPWSVEQPAHRMMLVLYSLLGAQPLGEEQAQTRVLLRERLEGGEVGWLEALRAAARLDAWRVQRADPHFVLRSLRDPDAPPAAVDNLIFYGDPDQRLDQVFGWVIRHDGAAVGLVALSLDDPTRVALAALPPDADDARLLTCALDPDGSKLAADLDDPFAPLDHDPDDADAPPPPDPDDALIAQVIAHLDMGAFHRGSLRSLRPIFKRKRWTREVIARARSADDLRDLIDAIHNLRFELCGHHLRDRHALRTPLSPGLEALAPLPILLAARGVHPDAHMPLAARPRLETHPTAVLILAPRHPLWRELSPRDPLGDALAWAHDRRDPSVLDAFARYEDEQRWLATFPPAIRAGLPLDDDALADVDLDDILHALVDLFEPLIQTTPLSALDLDDASLTRLTRALDPAPPQLGSLPERGALLRRLKGIGDTTVARLRAPLLDWMRRWRTARAGLDPQLVYREARRDPDDASPLQQGLDDLAALFNLDD